MLFVADLVSILVAPDKPIAVHYDPASKGLPRTPNFTISRSNFNTQPNPSYIFHKTIFAPKPFYSIISNATNKTAHTPLTRQFL